MVTAAEVSLGFSKSAPEKVEYVLGKFAVANTLSKAALLRAVNSLGLRFDQGAETHFYSQFQLEETSYDAKKLRLAGVLMAYPDKAGKAVALWDTWTGAPTEEVTEGAFKELVTVLVELSLESVMPLAMTTEGFSGDRLKVWGKSQAQKKDKAVSHFMEQFLGADGKQLTYQHFLEVIATSPDETLTSMQQIRATMERFRVMSAKFSSAFKKGGFSASLIPNKK